MKGLNSREANADELRSRLRARLLACALIACMTGACNSAEHGLVINEIVSVNDGAWADEWGEDEDYIELVNTSNKPIRTGGYVLSDDSGKRAKLPDRELRPGEMMLLVADGSPEQGPMHLPFKISSQGDVLILGDAHGFAVERVEVPALAINEALLRVPHALGDLVRCSGLSPGKSNGRVCGAPSNPTQPEPERALPEAPSTQGGKGKTAR